MAKTHDGDEIDRSVNSINYTEFTLKRKATVLSVLEKLGLVLLYVTIVVVIFVKSWWLGSLSLLAVVIAWYFTWPFTNVEFEYTTSSGEWRFSKIYGGGRGRKDILDIKIRDMEAIAPYVPEYADKYRNAKKYDFRASKKDTEDIYFAAFDEDGEKKIVIFRCTGKALKIFQNYNRENTVAVDTLRY